MYTNHILESFVSIKNCSVLLDGKNSKQNGPFPYLADKRNRPLNFLAENEKVSIW